MFLQRQQSERISQQDDEEDESVSTSTTTSQTFRGPHLVLCAIYFSLLGWGSYRVFIGPLLYFGIYYMKPGAVLGESSSSSCAVGLYLWLTLFVWNLVLPGPVHYFCAVATVLLCIIWAHLVTRNRVHLRQEESSVNSNNNNSNSSTPTVSQVKSICASISSVTSGETSVM